MWKYLYDALLQLLTSPWAAYMNKYDKQGRLVRDMFFNDVYQYSGLILFSICIISCLLYYFYFNKRFGSYYKKTTWIKWALATSLLVGVVTFFVGKSFLGSFLCPTTPLIAWLSVINIIYSIFLFLFLSIICQLIAVLVRRLFSYDISPMASRTPF